MAGGGFSSIFDLVRQSFGLECRRKDGYGEDGVDLVAGEGFSSIFNLLRQSLGLEKERECRRKDGYDEEGGG